MHQAPGVRTTDSQSYITVMGCLLDYQYIEVAHSGAQILVAVSTCEKCKHTRTCMNTQQELIALHTEPQKPLAVLFNPRERGRFPSFLHIKATATIILSVGVSPPPPILNGEIDPLFCLAANEPLQLLTGYSNTGRAVIVPFCAALFEYTRNSDPASMYICTRSCRSDSPAVGRGPGPSLQLSRHLSSDMSATHISTQRYSAAHRERRVTRTAF